MRKKVWTFTMSSKSPAARKTPANANRRQRACVGNTRGATSQAPGTRVPVKPLARLEMRQASESRAGDTVTNRPVTRGNLDTSEGSCAHTSPNRTWTVSGDATLIPRRTLACVLGRPLESAQRKEEV